MRIGRPTWLRFGQAAATLGAVLFVAPSLASGVESDDVSPWFLFLLFGIALSLLDKLRASVELSVNAPPFSFVERELCIDRAAPVYVHRAPHSMRLRVDGRTIADVAQAELVLFETGFGRFLRRLHIGIVVSNELCFLGTFRLADEALALRLLSLIAEALDIERLPSKPVPLSFLPSARSIQPILLFDALVLGLLVWLGSYLSLGVSLGLCLSAALSVYLLVLAATGSALRGRVIERRARAVFAEWGVLRRPLSSKPWGRLLANSRAPLVGSLLTLLLMAVFSGRMTLPTRFSARPKPFFVPGATLCLMDLDYDGIADPIGLLPRDPVERSYAPQGLIAVSATTGATIKEMSAPSFDDVMDIACRDKTMFTLSQAGAGASVDAYVWEGSSKSNWHKSLPGFPRRLFLTGRCVIAELLPRSTQVTAFAAIDSESGRDCVDYLGLDGTPEGAGDQVDVKEERGENPDWVLDWARRREVRAASTKRLRAELMESERNVERRAVENGSMLVSATLDARSNQYLRIWGRDRVTKELRWSKRYWIRVWDHLEVASSGPYALVRADGVFLAMDPKTGQVVWSASQQEHP